MHLIPALERQRHVDLCGFQASLVYAATSRSARDGGRKGEKEGGGVGEEMNHGSQKDPGVTFGKPRLTPAYPSLALSHWSFPVPVTFPSATCVSRVITSVPTSTLQMCTLCEAGSTCAAVWLIQGACELTSRQSEHMTSGSTQGRDRIHLLLP